MPVLKGIGNKLASGLRKRDRSPEGRSIKRVRTGNADTTTYEPTGSDPDAMDVDLESSVPPPGPSDLITSQAINGVAVPNGTQVELPQSDHTMTSPNAPVRRPLESGPRMRKTKNFMRRRPKTTALSDLLPEPSRAEIEARERNAANWRHSMNATYGPQTSMHAEMAQLGFVDPSFYTHTVLQGRQQAAEAERPHSVAVGTDEVRLDSVVPHSDAAKRQTWCASDSADANETDISRAAGAWAGRGRSVTLSNPGAGAFGSEVTLATKNAAEEPTDPQADKILMAQLFDGMGQLLSRVNEFEAVNRIRYDSMKSTLELEMAEMFAENEVLRGLLKKDGREWPRIAGRQRHSFHFGDSSVEVGDPLSEASQLRIKRERQERIRVVHARAARPAGFYPVAQRPRSMVADPRMSLEESMDRLSLLTSRSGPSSQGLLVDSEAGAGAGRSEARAEPVAGPSPRSSADAAQGTVLGRPAIAGPAVSETVGNDAPAPLSSGTPQLADVIESASAAPEAVPEAAPTAETAPSERPQTSRSSSAEQGTMERLRAFLGYGAASTPAAQALPALPLSPPDSNETSPKGKAPFLPRAVTTTAMPVASEVSSSGQVSPKSRITLPRAATTTAVPTTSGTGEVSPKSKEPEPEAAAMPASAPASGLPPPGIMQRTRPAPSPSTEEKRVSFRGFFAGAEPMPEEPVDPAEASEESPEVTAWAKKCGLDKKPGQQEVDAAQTDARRRSTNPFVALRQREREQERIEALAKQSKYKRDMK